MSQSQEKRCSKGQIEKFGRFGLLSAEREFSQKSSTPTVLSTYGSSTLCKISGKTNEPILRKMLRLKMDAGTDSHRTNS